MTYGGVWGNREIDKLNKAVKKTSEIVNQFGAEILELIRQSTVLTRTRSAIKN